MKNYPRNPSCLERNVLECGNNISDLIINEHHLIKKHQIYCLKKLNSRELYNIQAILKVEKPTAQAYFDKNFQNPELEWKDIYNLPRRVTINANLRIFQYKLFKLHNILYVNEMLYKLQKKVPPLFSFYMKQPENPIHLFQFCIKTNFFWTQLQHSFQNVLIIPPITPQGAIFGFYDHKINYHLIKHIPLIFKYYIYKTRENRSGDLKVHKIKNIEKNSTKQKNEKILDKNGNHCEKTHNTNFEIYGGAIIGVGERECCCFCILFSSICCYFLYWLRYYCCFKNRCLTVIFSNFIQ